MARRQHRLSADPLVEEQVAKESNQPEQRNRDIGRPNSDDDGQARNR